MVVRHAGWRDSGGIVGCVLADGPNRSFGHATPGLLSRGREASEHGRCNAKTGMRPKVCFLSCRTVQFACLLDSRFPSATCLSKPRLFWEIAGDVVSEGYANLNLASDSDAVDERLAEIFHQVAVGLIL